MKKIFWIIVTFLLFVPSTRAAWSIIPSKQDREELGLAFENGEFSAGLIMEFGLYLVSLLIEIAGVIAVIIIMIGGYRYVIGSMTEDKDAGKNHIKYGLFGFSVAVLSWVIVQLIVSFLTS